MWAPEDAEVLVDVHFKLGGVVSIPNVPEMKALPEWGWGGGV